MLKIIQKPVILLLTLTMLFAATALPTFASSSFHDVKETDWYADAVTKASQMGMVDGIGGGYFAPALRINRAMFTTMLWRALGCPTPKTKMSFIDLTYDTDGYCYYENAANWVAENGIVSLPFADTFSPNSKVSRQDAVLMLYRTASLSHSYQGAGSLIAFRDSAAVSRAANTAVCFAVGVGILKGDNQQQLRPRENITRAEAVAILVRYLDFLEKQETVAQPGISQKTVNLTVGDSVTLTATFDEAAGPYFWETNDASVARVSSDGVVTVYKNGSAVITARACNGQTATCLVTVQTRFALQYDTYAMTIGETGVLTTVFTPATETEAVTWSSSAPATVSVENGNITACKVGTANISATTASGETAVCTVTVTDAGEAPVFTALKSYLRTNGTANENDARYLRRIYNSEGISYAYALSYLPGEETIDLILTANDDVIADIVIDKTLSGRYAFSVVYQGLYVTEGTVYASVFNGVAGADVRITENSGTLSETEIFTSTNSILKLDTVLGNRILKLTGHAIRDLGFTAVADELEQ